MTIKQAKSLLAQWGITLRKTDAGDFRVNVRNGQESTAYYTNDLTDAVNTGKYMSGKAAIRDLNTGFTTGECHVCARPVTTGEVSSQDALSYCGDCGKVTCGDHRTEGLAERCTACARTAEVETHDIPSLLARFKLVRIAEYIGQNHGLTDAWVIVSRALCSVIEETITAKR
jgi:hypothetical protein